MEFFMLSLTNVSLLLEYNPSHLSFKLSIKPELLSFVFFFYNLTW